MLLMTHEQLHEKYVLALRHHKDCDLQVWDAIGHPENPQGGQIPHPVLTSTVWKTHAARIGDYKRVDKKILVWMVTV